MSEQSNWRRWIGEVWSRLAAWRAGGPGGAVAELKLRDTIWVIPPMIVILISELVRGQIGANPELFQVEKFTGMEVEETQRRIFFITMTVVYMSLGIGIIAYAASDLWKRLKLQAVLLLIPFAGIVLLGLFITEDPTCVWSLQGEASFEKLSKDEVRELEDKNCLFRTSYEVFGGEKDMSVFANMLNLIDLPDSNWVVSEKENAQPSLFKKFRTLLNHTSRLTVFAISVLVFGMISALAIGRARTAEALVAARERLEFYLFLTSVMLVVGIIFYMSYMYWPSFALSRNEDGFEIYNTIVKQMSLFTGVTYSLMMISIYLPIRSILVRWTSELPSAPTDEDEAVTPAAGSSVHPIFRWISGKVGVSDDQKAFYSYVFKIVSPVLAAWIAQFLNLGGAASGIG